LAEFFFELAKIEIARRRQLILGKRLCQRESQAGKGMATSPLRVKKELSPQAFRQALRATGPPGLCLIWQSGA